MRISGTLGRFRKRREKVTGRRREEGYTREGKDENRDNATYVTILINEGRVFDRYRA